MYIQITKFDSWVPYDLLFDSSKQNVNKLPTVIASTLKPCKYLQNE